MNRLHVVSVLSTIAVIGFDATFVSDRGHGTGSARLHRIFLSFWGLDFGAFMSLEGPYGSSASATDRHYCESHFTCWVIFSCTL